MTAEQTSKEKTTTVIGPDTKIRGEMVFDSTARVLGTFEGRIAARGEVQIGESAVCRANIEASVVIVDGLIEGDVTALERVQLNKKAKVVGDVTAGTMVVADGASFIGNCKVGEEAVRLIESGEAGAPPIEEGEEVEPIRRDAPAEVEIATARNGGDLESTLAGLEARLAGMNRKQPAAAE